MRIPSLPSISHLLPCLPLPVPPLSTLYQGWGKLLSRFSLAVWGLDSDWDNISSSDRQASFISLPAPPASSLPPLLLPLSQAEPRPSTALLEQDRSTPHPWDSTDSGNTSSGRQGREEWEGRDWVLTFLWFKKAPSCCFHTVVCPLQWGGGWEWGMQLPLKH